MVRSCAGKIAFPGELAAKAAAAHAHRTGHAVFMTAYRCRHCKAWHIGHLHKGPRGLEGVK